MKLNFCCLLPWLRMKHKIIIMALALLLLFSPLRVWAGEGRIFTLWPLVDYRQDEQLDYVSVNALGPFLNYERKGEEREFGLRPLYFHAADPVEGIGYSEYLYPLATRKTEPSLSFFQGLHLLNYDFGPREKGGDNKFSLFPFLFYGRTEDRGNYFAFFPLGGKIYDLFGRDEIRFALFPAYSQTRKKGTTVTNLLWPVFARVSGEDESGLKVWPLFGTAEKQGVYRKRFYLWPIFFRYDLRLDSADPMHRRVIFPLFVGEESPQLSSRTYLWPFFSHLEDRRKDYEEWNFPWPLFRIAHGAFKESVRFLPLYANERTGSLHKRWYLWPVYKIEETRTELLERRRDRVLYFLYSDIRERALEEDTLRKREVSLWPLFTYERIRGVSHFHTLSLLEPFFPENRGIERNWSPLWRLYQRKWDTHGNEVSSFLWNLYWKERRADGLAMEVFPLFRYQQQAGDSVDWQLLKGLFRYHSSPEGKKVYFLFLPWGIGSQVAAAKTEG
jgi:hypothetical protein